MGGSRLDGRTAVPGGEAGAIRTLPVMRISRGFPDTRVVVQLQQQQKGGKTPTLVKGSGGAEVAGRAPHQNATLGHDSVARFAGPSVP